MQFRRRNMAALTVALRKTSTFPKCILRPVVACASESHHRHAGTYHHSLTPKGRGGRSSFSGTVAAVFGASGFLGQYVVCRLGREGSQVMIPHRCDHYYLMHYKVMGDLGQILFRQCNLRDLDLIADIMKHCNVVINLVGKDYETRNFSFEDTHIEGARNLARIAKKMGVNRFIHVSALNADMGSPSKFLRTKAAGETVVRAEYPDATILRPAQMFGREDRYFNHFANQRFFGGVPLFFSAGHIVKRPVYVADVGQAVMEAIRNPETAGMTFELVGPNGYLLPDLVDFIYRVTRRPYIRYPVPRYLLRFVAGILEKSPFEPLMTRDMLELQHTSENVTPGMPGLEDLGITPTLIEMAAIRGLRRHRADRYFDLGIDEVEPAPTVK
ncbi:NADH dehydrogenase [ubiquinone] 1 alpha subcomplex subunit 9, mitochondrial-like [Acanthaster planci]|uniref:NADH dehydrogenase [ubiquinone] 1 alpha subcomplex subunit 9, mitochondrial n=1 Tax=Acanthaster planci TaxID=133434 RepID=A0A8B7Y597_ACAPL|nr:NADH dehydrogenase [ubiquinone] 1 alpha subcomplex subunit 9, mitochondrial-like [Acanthaster planci]